MLLLVRELTLPGGEGPAQPGPVLETMAEGLADGACNPVPKLARKGVLSFDLEATARQLTSMASAIRQEGACDLSVGEALNCSEAHASRTVYRALARLGLAWKVPITEFVYPSNRPGENLTVPYLKPSDLVKCFLTHCPDLLFGGASHMKEQSQQLQTFWQHYRAFHPCHIAFHEFPHNLEQVIPLVLHGDEGRGLRKGNCAVLTLESPLGLSSHDVDSCLKTCSCAQQLHAELSSRLGVDPQMGHDECAISQAQRTNMQHHSFLTRFLVWAVHSRQYKEANGMIHALLQEVARDLRSLFYEGITLPGSSKPFFVAIIGMKGDLKWLVREVCIMNRCYLNLAKVIDAPMCSECLAGSHGLPFEDVSLSPVWEPTLWEERPFDPEYVLPLRAVPWEHPPEKAVPERQLRRDVFHTLKTGVLRDWSASCLLVLVDKWQYFDDAAAGNSLDTKLQRSHGHFMLYCATIRKSPALHSFTRALLNRKNSLQHPWFNIKGSDCMMVLGWLLVLLRACINCPLNDHHLPALHMMLEGTSAALKLFETLYDHGLWMSKPCGAYVHQLGYQFTQKYVRMADVCLNELHFHAFALKPKLHAFCHSLVELKQQLRDPSTRRVPNINIWNCEQNEDFVGKLCRTARRVHQRHMSLRVIQLYLTKSKALYKRHLATERPASSRAKRRQKRGGARA